MWQELEEFTTNCNNTKDLDQLFSLIDNFLKKRRFNLYAFGNLYGDSNALMEDRGPAISMNLPQEWVDHYFEKEYYNIDPVVLVSPHVTRFLKWDNLRKYQPEFFEEAAGYGLKNGVAIPLRTFDGCYVLSIMSSEEFEIDEKLMTVLEISANHFFRCYLTIRKIKHTQAKFSEKQIQAIQLAMVGKKNQEIAKIISRTIDGVDYMFKDARNQLECKTIPELVAKAVQQGIVQI